MKKNVFFLLVLLLMGVQSVVSAPVDVQSARKVAQAYLQMSGIELPDNDVVDISASTPFTEFYTFSINQGRGFILVAGDDNTEPVLGYALRNPFPTVAIPAHVRAWLEGYEQEIRHNRTLAKGCDEARRQWRRLLHGQPVTAVCKATVGPFLTTTWNQSPYYNALCPYDSAHNGRAVCGCTATATAQILKYFNHPATGYGNCTYTHPRLGQLSADYNVDYQWDSMPAALTNTSTDAQINAVATLIYHIGVAVHMDYSATGSGGKTASYGYGGEPSSENAFKYNFKYSPYVWTAFRIDYDFNGWKALMRHELDNGRPILYAGYDERQSGHAFVIDGYNTYGLYHFNWGWGGQYDGDFRLSNLNPGSYHFDLFATATVGIEPYSGWDPEGLTSVSVGAEGVRGAAASDGIVTGAGSYRFGDTITLTATAANEYTRFVQWSDGCKYNPRVTVATGGDIAFTAQFAPLAADTMRYFTCDNAMNRASNVTPGLGADSVWGIKLPASALHPHRQLTAVRFMGREAGNHTLSVYSGTDSPQQLCYSATFYDSLDYPFTFYTHTLQQPVAVDEGLSLWIVLKCTDVDTPGVFSIYGGNPNSLLVGDDLHPFNDQPIFSWMIEGLFSWDGVGVDPVSADSEAFQLYPNPATGRVHLAVSPSAGTARLQLFDETGRTVVDRALVGDKTDIDGLRPGLYIVKVITPYHTAVKKLIVR